MDPLILIFLVALVSSDTYTYLDSSFVYAVLCNHTMFASSLGRVMRSDRTVYRSSFDERSYILTLLIISHSFYVPVDILARENNKPHEEEDSKNIQGRGSLKCT